MNIFKYSITIFLLGLLTYSPLVAQMQVEDFTYKLHHWTTEDGLPEWNIFSFLEDHKGQLWLGTDKSLISFDGYQFKVRYTTPENEMVIHRLQEDNEENIWFLERNRNEEYKLLYYHSASDSIVCFNDLPNVNKTDFYRVLIQDDQLLIFNQKGDFFDKKGVFQFHLPFQSEHLHFCFLSGKNIWVVEEKPLLVSNEISSVVSPPDYHIYLYEPENGQILYSDTLTAGDFVYSFWEEKGDLYSLKQPRVAVKDFSSLSCVKYGVDGKKAFPLTQSSFNVSHRNTEYIGWVEQFAPLYFQENIVVRALKKSVLFYYKGELIPIKNTPLEIFEQPNSVSKLFIDKSGDFWLSSLDGLYKVEIQQSRFRKYLHEPSFEYSTRGILVDKKGNLQVHTYKGTQQINLKTGKTKTHRIQTKKSLRNYFVNGFTLYEDEAGLWMGQHGSSSIYLKKNNQLIVYPFEPLESHRIYSILPVGAQIWIGTSDGIFQVDKSQKRLIELYSADVVVQYMYENSKGIWAATNKGLYFFDKKGKLQRQFLEDFIKEQLAIKHLFEDKDGTFWLATTNGLIHWHPVKNEILDHMTTKDGLSQNNLHSIYGDKNGYLWMSSDKGLMRFHKASKKIKTYKKKDGIAHDEFNHTSHYQAENGQLFFGGVSGVTAFYPDEILTEEGLSSLYPFVVGGEITNGKSGEVEPFPTNINIDKKLTLSPAENFITIQLTAFSLEKNPNIEYRWQIGDQQPVIQRARNIRINNVNYGKQTLKIKVREVGQDWSENTLTIDVYRAKPFFMRWWFITLSIVFILLIIRQFYQNRTRKLEREKEKLSALVKRRTAQIERDKETIEEQTKQLQQLNQNQRQFFTNITHELRTPLTLVIGPLEQVLGQPLGKKEQAHFKMMLKNAKHLERLINQLLDFSKLRNGQMQLEIVHGDLSIFTDKIIHRFQALAVEKIQSLEFHSSETPFEVHFDKGKWDKIIFNLVSNAIKFTPKGGKIQVRLARNTIFNSISLSVKDTGIGIQKENLENIFNRFYQVDGSTKRNQEGTGIGLSLVKELVELQGGQIKVDSQVNEGTAFEITIPIVYQSAVSNVKNTSKTSDFFVQNHLLIEENNLCHDKSATLNVLVIEDNADMRTYIKSCLASFNYQIETATDGADGIEKALTHIPDLIISDVMMPRKDGYEVISAIRQNIATSHIPIILLTAKSSLESRLKGIERGADVYLTKPFSSKELLLRIHKLIELRQLMQLRYQNGLHQEIAPRVPKLKKEDEFIQNLQQLILDNLNNNEMNSDWLAKQIRINRTHLYQKVKALTGHTVANFVNLIRLEEAKKLMKERNDNLSAISYKVGFSSPSQFSKVFKRILDKSPSDYMSSLID